MAFRIEDHTPALEPVELPRGGRTLPAREFTLGMQKLAQRAEAGGEDAGEAGRELLRRCLPGITDDEIDDLSMAEQLLVVGHCAKNLAATVEYLKNAAGAGETGNPIPPSAPTTSTSSPSPASPSPTGGTGSKSKRRRSGARSTPSTV